MYLSVVGIGLYLSFEGIRMYLSVVGIRMYLSVVGLGMHSSPELVESIWCHKLVTDGGQGRLLGVQPPLKGEEDSVIWQSIVQITAI